MGFIRASLSVSVHSGAWWGSAARRTVIKLAWVRQACLSEPADEGSNGGVVGGDFWRAVRATHFLCGHCDGDFSVARRGLNQSEWR
jgi:hypothetical protein